MKKILFLCVVVLAGCASAKPAKGPNGENAWLVECGKAVQEKCAAKAADLCPNGYVKLERKANEYDDLSKVGNVGVLEIKADTTERMLIQCK